ncbi:MAG TPA: DUF364 domain-containing protein [Opitutales bacterium]|nr:DUF364 domain-containing protein [Opitutales bacterium]
MNGNPQFWRLHNALIDTINTGERIRSFAAGPHWFAVRGESSLGLAMGPAEGYEAVSVAGKVAGMRLADAAVLARSWNWADASLGMASINAWHNTPARVADWTGKAGIAESQANVFSFLSKRIKGKKVAVIGHFFGMEEVAKIWELTILERKPQKGDLPDPACEVVLPQSDFVIITGTTMLNKTLPRLLELSKGAYVALAGPTVTLWPGWFEHGVCLLAGVVVEEPDRVLQLVQEGGAHTFFGNGARMVIYEKPGV